MNETPINLCTMDEIIIEIKNRYPSGSIIGYQKSEKIKDEKYLWFCSVSGNENILSKLYIAIGQNVNKVIRSSMT